MAELLWFHRLLHNGINFFIAWPNIFQRHRVAILVIAQWIFFDIKANRSSNRVGHNQWRRRQERLFSIRMTTAIEVTVTRQDRSRVQSRSIIPSWIFGSKAPLIPLQVVHAKADDTEAQLLKLLAVDSASSKYIFTVLEPGASEVFTHGLRV